jgi:hypothetical protein
MLFKKWLPWKFVIKRAARAYGFLDPLTLLARLRRFGHPSEVHEPIELVRAGVVFHARGLINTRAIQYNLDWVWPFWIVKQFKPNDISFIPRGFAFSHVNLTHRNWTAVGHPDMPFYPIVDPAGLVTPHFDGWSIDFWILGDDGVMLAPSESDDVRQTLDMTDETLAVVTQARLPGFRLDTTVWVDYTRGFDTHIRVNGRSQRGGALVLAVRPYNPEGIYFIDNVAVDGERRGFRINGQDSLTVDRPPETVLFSNYENGDVAHRLKLPEDAGAIDCDIGMATAAALFPLDSSGSTTVSATVPLLDPAGPAPDIRVENRRPAAKAWKSRIDAAARLDVPDDRVRFLYDAAVRTMLLLTADEAYPGPYTYKRFWFRDACLMVHALLGIGLSRRADRIIRAFPERQTMAGYFQSQEGEWDSNGQVLWIAGKLYALTGAAYGDDFLQSLLKGAEWIVNKRLTEDNDTPHAGLLPAGFSAEHLGPNDYYYWDNFWAVAGLQAAARLAGAHGLDNKQRALSDQAEAFLDCITRNVQAIPQQRSRGAIPASPYRRLDAGAIGSLVADYPLRLFEPGHPAIMRTTAYLMANCFHSGAFFQDMIHAGINVYLTLAIGQTLLRAGDPGYRALMRTVAELASPTGQWPEAIHPFTRGGCMGDGQHGWAAAEWLMMIRNLFVREEGTSLVIGSGIFPEWIDSGRRICFGPTLVPGGRLSIRLRKTGDSVHLEVDTGERGNDIEMVSVVPGYERRTISNAQRSLDLQPL